MAGKRNYEWPLATEWDAAAFLTQDKSGGVTQRVSPALVETKLEADGFPKIPSPSANEVAVYGVGGWDSVKLVDANIDAAAAIGWGKISKTGAVAADVGALPDASPTIASGKLTTAVSTTSGASLNVPNGAAPTSPAVGDVWADASRLFMQGRVLAVTKGASNSFGSGSAFSVLDAASPTKGAHIQLNEAGGMDIWTLQGGSWIKELTLPIDGSIQLENLAGTGTRPAAIDSTGKLVVGVFTAKDCLNVYTTAPTAAPNYIRANSYTAAIATSASYRGSLKGIVDGSTVSVKFTIGGVTVAGGDQLDFVNGGPFVLEWWLETYAPGADAFLNFRMTIGSYSSDRLYCSLNQFVTPSLGSSDDLKIEFKIGNTSVTVRTMSEIVERIG